MTSVAFTIERIGQIESFARPMRPAAAAVPIFLADHYSLGANARQCGGDVPQDMIG